MSVVTFDNRVFPQFQLDAYHDKQALLQAISQIAYSGGGTSIHDGLQYVREKSFTATYGARKDVARIAVVLTDGQGNYALTAQQAALLKQAGVTVFAIGVGNINQKELEAIASHPNSTHMFVVNDYNALTNIHGSLKQATCEGNLHFHFHYPSLLVNFLTATIL